MEDRPLTPGESLEFAMNDDLQLLIDEGLIVSWFDEDGICRFKVTDEGAAYLRALGQRGE